MRTFIEILNTMTPLALAGGLTYAIILLIRNQRGVAAISTNHLSGLPDMQATLERIEAQLKAVNDNVVFIRGRLNGRGE